MNPNNTPTGPQLRLLKGLAAGRELVQVRRRARVQFGTERVRVYGDRPFSTETLLACIHRAWVAQAWWVRPGTLDPVRVTSISDLGRAAIKRAEAKP